ncbi:MAG: hypothetical protein RIS76_2967 [Verrucomicrobiota bacterium]
MNPHPAASPRWIRAAGWILLAKLIYLGTVFTVLKLWNHPESIPKFEVRWPIDVEPTFESHFATWDAAHYLLLATQGYAEGVRSCAFYPLWPLLWRGVIALGAPPVWGGLVLANLLSTLGLALVYRAVALRHDASRAFWVVLFMAVHPGNVFLQFSYSECVFLVLLVCLWSGLEEHRWWPAAFGALLLPLSRAIGVFAMLPIGVWLLRHPVIAPVWNRCVSRAPRFTHRLLAVEADPSRGGGRWLALLALPLIGWAAYLGLMAHWTGNPFEGFVAQKTWGRHSILNLVNVPKFLLEYLSPRYFHEFADSMLDRLCFLTVAYTLPSLWRSDRSLIPWAYILGILPAMSGSFTSYLRFSGMAFPVFLIWSAPATTRSFRILRWVGLVVLGFLHLHLIRNFVLGHWAG